MIHSTKDTVKTLQDAILKPYLPSQNDFPPEANINEHFQHTLSVYDSLYESGLNKYNPKFLHSRYQLNLKKEWRLNKIKAAADKLIEIQDRDSQSVVQSLNNVKKRQIEAGNENKQFREILSQVSGRKVTVDLPFIDVTDEAINMIKQLFQ